MCVRYPGDDIVAEHTRVFSDEEVLLEEEKKFLRYIIQGIREYLGNRDCIKVDITDAYHEFCGEFHLIFTFNVNIIYKQKWNKYEINFQGKKQPDYEKFTIREVSPLDEEDSPQVSEFEIEMGVQDTNQDVYEKIMNLIKNQFREKRRVSLELELSS